MLGLSDRQIVARQWREMMSEARHTPGPWHVNHDRPDDKHSQLSITNGDARIIANVVTYAGTHGLDGGNANARLIAAAPDMLEALLTLAPLIGWENFSQVELEREHRLGNGMAAPIMLVRAAIAKATGG